ncbi:MAG TPA: T9SS type A sorting domain-containing protein, partial [Adhaeribacter sp.]|nr:T9SS type A sorting domain-containing protein [Adhaeribacter sp.]
PLTFNAAGEVEFGPATGFPLANTATNFKVTFAAAGTYDYTLAIVDAATGTALATPTAESVTVAAFVNPTIASTLNGRTGVVVGVQEAYDVTTTAGDMAGDLVKVKATLATPAQAADMTLEYFETATSTWMPLTFDANGVLLFGPATGFPLANATSNFRVTYNAAGTYTTTLEIVDAATGVALVPGVTESVTVTAPVVNPTIASDLDSRAGVLTTVEEEFEVTTTAGTFAGQNILVKMTLTTPAQAADMAVQYFETATSTWMPLTFDASGVLTFGPATGFPLANATSDFKVTFSAAGTYAYTLEIVDAATPATILASASESVTVTAFEVPTIVSDLNNRANVLTRREENFLIATTAGDNAGEMVKIKIALTDAAQRDDIDLSYQDGTGNFVPVAFDVNGELLIGPAAGFALADDTVNFKIAFNATGIYEYTLAIVDAVSGVVLGDTVVESVTIMVNGIKEDALARTISLYPNPASDMLNINLGTIAKAEVTVMDLTGKQVAEAKAVAGAASLNVANLKAGSYLLRVKTAEGIAHKRFVVVR